MVQFQIDSFAATFPIKGFQNGILCLVTFLISSLLSEIIGTFLSDGVSITFNDSSVFFVSFRFFLFTTS